MRIKQAQNHVFEGMLTILPSPRMIRDTTFESILLCLSQDHVLSTALGSHVRRSVSDSMITEILVEDKGREVKFERHRSNILEDNVHVHPYDIRSRYHIRYLDAWRTPTRLQHLRRRLCGASDETWKAINKVWSSMRPSSATMSVRRDDDFLDFDLRGNRIRMVDIKTKDGRTIDEFCPADLDALLILSTLLLDPDPVEVALIESIDLHLHDDDVVLFLLSLMEVCPNTQIICSAKNQDLARIVEVERALRV